MGLPYTFVPDTIADANQVNANFQYLLTQQPYFIPAVPMDGTSDSFPAMNAAIGAAAANGGGTVLVPAGNFKLSGMLQVTVPNVNIMGMGQGTTTLVQNFSPSSANPAIIMVTANGGVYQDFTLQGPGLTATGAVPGPTTSTTPQLGSGWGFLVYTGKQITVNNVSSLGTYHGFGSIIFTSIKFQFCEAGMGGAQVNPQYGFYCQGPAGTAATGQIVLAGTPTIGDTLTAQFNDQQGNVINTGPYTVTAANAGKLTATAIAFAQFINNSDAVQGPLANWNPCAASGPDVNLSIDVPQGTAPATYFVSTTGVMTASPTSATPVAGGSNDKNPISHTLGFFHCSMPQAQLNIKGVGTFASSEGIHIDGGCVSIGVENFGTTGALYTVRLVNANSGSDKDPKFVQIKDISGDHTRVSAVSLENGNIVRVDDPHIIANFGQGPPPTSFAINIGPNMGSWQLNNPNVASCDSGGIGIAAGNGTITNPKIQSVGRSYLSGINLYGSAAIVGLTIKGGKIGAPDLSQGGGGSNSYAIDLAGPGSPSVFTGTVQSLTIEDVDVTGSAGAINLGTVASASLAEFGLAAYITIKNNAGFNPVLGIAAPTIPIAGVGANVANAALNPYYTDCMVLLVPAGGATVTQVIVYTWDGNIARAGLSLTAPFTWICPANAAILPLYSSGTCTWNWVPT